MRFDLSDEELMFQKMARDFVKREIDETVAKQIDHDNKTPRNFLKKFGDVGLLGLTIPRSYGGVETSAVSDAVVIEEIAKTGTGIEWLVSMNNSIAASINHFGSEEIKGKYLKPVCKGEKSLSILFTEPATGSDPRLITTTAMAEGDNYIINGEKRFISWAAWDGYGTLFAKDDTGKITCFLIEKNVDGYSTGPLYEKIGAHAQESLDVRFQNMKVSKANIVGDKGKGFDVLLWWIAAEKIQQSAASLGIAEAALEESIRYATGRMLKAGPMSQLQGIQWTLAEMQTKIEAARWLIYKTACLYEEQAPNWMMMAALTKNFVIPAAVDVTILGMQIHSAYGYVKDAKISRLHQAALGGLGIATSLQINKSIIGSSLVR